ncbi:cytochrome P450 [Mycena alexandri]|uniref:Cytochrome P450 n=1 Tax=Mycena alexandri TaxID=1745969 RepID=A0AAD6WUR5_9AGAR|nr:cytochrome P450 [Mycena alexandri]
MPDLIPIVSVILSCVVVVYLGRVIVYRDCTVQPRLCDLPGPSRPHFFHGHHKEMAGDPGITDRWRVAFGRTFQFRGLFNIMELHTSDTKATAHIVSNLLIYTKTPTTRYNLARLWGDGIMSQEGYEHKIQRRIMTPVFSGSKMRVFTPIFNRNATRLRDLWKAEFAHGCEGKKIDVLPWLRRAALDSMGETGLDYRFNSLGGGEPSKLMKAIHQLLHTPGSNGTYIIRLAQASFPILRYLPLLGSRNITAPRNTLLQIGAEILAERKSAVATAADGAPPIDMLSSMIMVNNALPIEQRLSDDTLIAQIPTLIVSGHENTSISTAWALHNLAVHQDMQSKLRAEIFSVQSDSPTYDELNELPYLEAVIKESMRLRPSVEYTSRVAAMDDILPLGEPVVDKRGKAYSAIPVLKGQKIHLPLRALNVDKGLWGADADEFSPERWEKLPEAVSTIPSVYSHLFSFYAGPHGCIAYRYAVIEQKALLFNLVRSFEFHNAVPPEAIGRTSGTSFGHPCVLHEREKGTQLPLIVKPYKKQ